MNRTYGSFFCYLVIRNMMLTTSVAAAIRSDSFSKSVTHITPTKGVNRHSPVAGFIIAHRFVMGKHKTEQTIACSVFVCDPKSEVVRSVRGHDRSIHADTLIMDLRLSQGTLIIDRKLREALINSALPS